MRPGANVEIVPGDLPLTITYKQNGGTVRGTVQGCASLEGRAAGQVMSIPQDPALHRDGFILRTTFDQNGRFEILAVRPGAYYGLAVAADDPVEPRLSGFGEIRLGVELDQSPINLSA
jgi:hypothetical protein